MYCTQFWKSQLILLLRASRWCLLCDWQLQKTGRLLISSDRVRQSSLTGGGGAGADDSSSDAILLSRHQCCSRQTVCRFWSCESAGGKSSIRRFTLVVSFSERTTYNRFSLFSNRNQRTIKTKWRNIRTYIMWLVSNVLLLSVPYLLFFGRELVRCNKGVSLKCRRRL